jgi:hypothetical protein
MPTAHENRKANLIRLIEMNNDSAGRGGARIVATRAGVASSTISQIALGLDVRPAANERRKPGKIHQMGNEVACKIEAAFGMEHGAMDRPFAPQVASGLSVAQRDLLVTLEAMILSGCLSDDECTKERDLLLATYPLGVDGFGVRVIYCGSNALRVAHVH